MAELLFGTALLAAFFGGVVALLAPCCVSVLLPAYLAAGFRHRFGIVAATVVFAAGVATLIVPIALGARALSAAVSGHHVLVFSIGGVAMLAGGLAMVAGWKPRLPMPGMRTSGGTGWGATYGLGVFSGIASACCAPVLAGVAVLSGAAGSFTAALAIGLTYVAGMVAPLLLIALAWDRYDWGSSRLLAGVQVPLRLGGLRWRLAMGSLLSGLLLIGMGVLTIALAITGPAMPNTGWQVTFTAWLQHWASILTRGLSWLPGWVVALVLLAAAGLIVAQIRRTGSGQRAPNAAADDVMPGGDHGEEHVEEVVTDGR
jgi:cytochrome c-type biogenesis protein